MKGPDDKTCYIERSRVREILLGAEREIIVGAERIPIDVPGELLKEVDRLPIVTASDETAWLIEFFGQGEPTYYGKTDELLGMTADHRAAIRFARQQDAQAVIDDIGWTEAQAIEHTWVDGKLHSLAARTALR